MSASSSSFSFSFYSGSRHFTPSSSNRTTTAHNPSFSKWPSLRFITATLLFYLIYLLMASPDITFVNSIPHIHPNGYYIKAALVITRHGDRTPIKLFPKTRSTWPEGLGQLTWLGMKQHYDLGQRFRKRYSISESIHEHHRLIDDVFLTHQVFARSTPKERTLMSAQSFMHGLFPPGSGHPEALPGGIQPVPIHSVHRENDHVLYAYKNCKKLKALVKEYRKSQIWAEMTEKTTELRANLSEIFGFDVQLKDVAPINTILNQEIRHNKTLHEGVTPELMEQVKETYHWLVKNKFPTREMGLLAGGHLPLYIYSLFKDTIENKNKAKFTLFSAHDGTILALLAALGIQDFKPPEFATYWLFELIQDANTQEYFVHILFNDEPLPLPGLPEYCPFDLFAKHMHESFHHDWHDQCQHGEEGEEDDEGEKDTHALLNNPSTPKKSDAKDQDQGQGQSSGKKKKGLKDAPTERVAWELLAGGVVIGLGLSFMYTCFSKKKSD